MNFDFKQLSARSQVKLTVEPFHRWLTDEGEIVTIFHRVSNGYILRFPERADFTIDLDKKVVICVPAPQASKQIITAIYYNQVMPLVRSHEGELVFHASAAAVDGAALAFLGPSGRGKSTLVAGFARAGHPFLTDDGLWLEKNSAPPMVLPNQAFVRLWPDSEAEILNDASVNPDEEWREKCLIQAGDLLPFQNKAIPLKAIYVLLEGDSEEVSIQDLKPAEALLKLVEHSFLLDVEDMARVRTHFDMVAVLANSIQCFSLAYPRHYPHLANVVRQIVDHQSAY